MVVMSLIDADQFVVLGRHEFHLLEDSLRPGWYGPAGMVMGIVSLVDLVLVLVTKKRQGLHDIVGDTVVVNVAR